MFTRVVQEKKPMRLTCEQSDEVEYKGVCVKKLVQHLKAQNDPSGNPQRLFLVYNPISGDVMEIIDEGYRGKPEHTRTMTSLPSINILRSDYHDWLREKPPKGDSRMDKVG